MPGQVLHPAPAHLGELDLVAIGIGNGRDQRTRAEVLDGVPALDSMLVFEASYEADKIKHPERHAHRAGTVGTIRDRIVGGVDGEVYVA